MSKNLSNKSNCKELSNVEICIAHTNSICKQDYSNIKIRNKSIKFPGVFFNECLEEINENTIYGFLSNDNNFSFSNSVSKCISVFQHHEMVQLIYTDYLLQDKEYTYYQHMPTFHPNLLNSISQLINTPFLVRGSILKKTNAKFHPTLKHLVLHGFIFNICRKAFAIHLAEPLFSRTGNRNTDVTQELNLLKQWQTFVT